MSSRKELGWGQVEQTTAAQRQAERDELLAAMQQEENYADARRMVDLQYRHAEVERELDEKNETWANWE